MPKLVTYSIQVEMPDYKDDSEYLEMRDMQLEHLEMAVESPIFLIGSGIDSEEDIDG